MNLYTYELGYKKATVFTVALDTYTSSNPLGIRYM